MFPGIPTAANKLVWEVQEEHQGQQRAGPDCLKTMGSTWDGKFLNQCRARKALSVGAQGCSVTASRAIKREEQESCLSDGELLRTASTGWIARILREEAAWQKPVFTP